MYLFLICHLISFLVTHCQYFFVLSQIVSINLFKDLYQKKKKKCMLGCNQLSKKQPPPWLWQLAGERGSALGRNIASWWQHSQERVTFPLLSLGCISKQLKKTDSEASLQTARELQKSGRFLIKIQFHKTVEHLAEKVARVLFTSWAVLEKQVKACS